MSLNVENRSRAKKNQKVTFNKSYIYLLFFLITILSASFLNIFLTNKLESNNKQIVSLSSKVEILKNSIAVEKKNNSTLKRNSLKTKAKELGMHRAKHQDIIDIWWNKESINAK
tara:strand:- start:4948 stop:5289 length:342 start_codon:yes stop_codon:yes gene_type:complete